MVKRILFIVTAIMIACNSFAGEITTEAKITHVIVYLQGASIFTTSTVQIPQGVSVIRISKQSEYIDANSVQVNGKGNFTIIGVNTQLNYLEKQKVSSEITNLENNKKSIQLEIDELNNENAVYITEEKLLETNMSLKGQNTNLSALELEKAANFYRTRLIEIKKKKLNLSEQIKKLKLQITDIDNQLTVLQNKSDRPTGEIIVNVSSKIAQTIELEASYFIYNANWIPTYDFRVNDVNSPVKVQYKAIITQGSGITWDNVNVTLSTGNPTLGGTAPILYKWILTRQYENYKRKASVSLSNKALSNQAPAIAEDVSMAMGYAIEKEDATSSVTSSLTTQKMTTIEFEIDENITLKSFVEEAYVTIKEYNIPAQYLYICVPKLDKDAFLTANITDFEKYNFLSGNANLYFEGAYVGNSFIDLEKAQDTLQVSLGRDKGIVVERKQTSEYSGKNLLGNKRKEVFAWDILVKNNKPNPIQIKIIDQIPVSGESDIEVTNISYPEGTLKKETNNVYWQFTLDKQASKKLQLTYDISYPKDWKVNTK